MEQKKRLAALLLAVCLLLSLTACGQKTDSAGDEPATPKIAYAEGVTAVEDPDALQKAVDEMYEQARTFHVTSPTPLKTPMICTSRSSPMLS